jgi:hypothetical protein
MELLLQPLGGLLRIKSDGMCTSVHSFGSHPFLKVTVCCIGDTVHQALISHTGALPTWISNLLTLKLLQSTLLRSSTFRMPMRCASFRCEDPASHHGHPRAHSMCRSLPVRLFAITLYRGSVYPQLSVAFLEVTALATQGYFIWRIWKCKRKP